MRGTRTILVFGLVSALLCGLYTSAEAQGLRLPPLPADEIQEIRIQGTRRVENQAVRNVLGTRLGYPMDRDQIRRDIFAIRSLTTRRGTPYFDDVLVRYEQTDEGLVVIYQLQEKPIIARFEYRFVMNDKLEGDLDDVVDIEEGDVFDLAHVQLNVNKIEELYREKGYYLAQVSFQWELLSSGDVHLTMIINEYEEVEVRRVTFVGNQALSDEELSAVIATRPGERLAFLTGAGVFNEMEFANDRRRLRAFYYEFGYIDVDIGEPAVEISRDMAEIYITIPIEEGPQYTISSVAVRGDLLAPAEELMDRFVQLRPDEVFKMSSVRNDSTRLTTFYQDHGYAFANVNLAMNPLPQSREVEVGYDIQKGDLVYVSRIVIRGNQTTRDDVIRREMRIHESDLYNNTNIRRSQARIERLGFFEGVNIREVPLPGGQFMNLEVEVSERPTGQFQAGAGFSSVESFIFMATVAQNNFLGRGQNLALQASISSIRTIFSLGFTEPYLFGTRWQFGFEVFNRELIYTDFSRTSLGFSLTAGHPITDDILMSATYQFENVYVEPGGRSGRRDRQISNLFQGGLTSSIRTTLIWDTRNNRLFPSRGFLQTASLELADALLGSENEFVRARLVSRWYYSVFTSIVLKFNAIVGIVATTNPNQPVPIFERFFLGGPNSVRGFERATLSPTQPIASVAGDPDSFLFGFPIGGNKELTLNFEIEFPIVNALQIRGVLFADAGNALSEDDPFTLRLDILEDDRTHFNDVLRTAVGMGFRWMSPMGPLRFEWGFPLSPLATEDTSIFEFSVGNFL